MNGFGNEAADGVRCADSLTGAELAHGTVLGGGRGGGWDGASSVTLLLLTHRAIGHSLTLTLKQMAVQASFAVPAECPDGFPAKLNTNSLGSAVSRTNRWYRERVKTYECLIKPVALTPNTDITLLSWNFTQYTYHIRKH